MKCIQCEKNEAVEKGLCEECIKNNLLISISGSLDVTICPKCGSVKIGKKWYTDGRHLEAISSRVPDFVKVSDKSFKVKPVGVTRMNEIEETVSFVTTISKEGVLEFEYSGEIPIRKTINSCPTCNKITGSYFEATVQVRTSTGEYTDIVDKIKDEAVEMVKKLNIKDPESFISSIKKRKEGVDILLGKRSDGLKISRHVLDTYFSNLVVSKTLVGRKNNADFYRYTYRLRILNAVPGSVVSEKGKHYLVSEIRSDLLVLLDPRTENKHYVSRSDFFVRDFKLVQREPSMRGFIVVSKSNNEMTLMDKKTFELVEFKGHTDKEEVDLVEYDGKYFLF